MARKAWSRQYSRDSPVPSHVTNSVGLRHPSFVGASFDKTHTF